MEADFRALYERASRVATEIVNRCAHMITLAIPDFPEIQTERGFLIFHLDDTILFTPNALRDLSMLKLWRATRTNVLGISALKRYDKTFAFAKVLETLDYETHIPIMFTVDSARFQMGYPVASNLHFAIKATFKRLALDAFCCNCMCAKTSATATATTTTTATTVVCDDPVVTNSMCSGCRRVVYCSRECQLADWAHHKPECKFIRAFAEQRK